MAVYHDVINLLQQCFLIARDEVHRVVLLFNLFDVHADGLCSARVSYIDTGPL